MKERPILFSAPMVRAILAGTKLQTRRVVKGVKHFPEWGSAVGMVGGAWRYGSPAGLGLSDRGDHWSVTLDEDHLRRMCTSEAYGWGAGAGCPYGQPGDRLWVREAFSDVYGDGGDEQKRRESLMYRADGETDPNVIGGRWTPSIHMPRWASRITLEITGVRVERLQAITFADSLAEGIVQLRDGGFGLPAGEHYHCADPRQSYLGLWEAINGPGSVHANPWVWVVEFKRVEAP